MKIWSLFPGYACMKVSTMDFSPLGDTLKLGEDRILERVFGYAKKTGFIKHAPSMAEAWRGAIRGLTDQICLAATLYKDIPELSSEEDYAQDCLASFGIIEAQKHRSRGVTLTMFFGWNKYYRQSFREFIEETNIDIESKAQYLLLLDRCFDRIELGFINEWFCQKNDDIIEDLRSTNFNLNNKKNRYKLIFESFPHPVFLLNNAGYIVKANCAARDTFTELHLLNPHDNEPAAPPPALDWLRSQNLNEIKHSDFFIGEKILSTRQGDRCFSIFGEKSLDFSGNDNFYIITLSDITERKEAEEVSLRLAKVYDVLSHTNQAIVRMETPDSLFKKICHVAINIGHLKIALINQVDKQTKKLQTIAFDGIPPHRSSINPVHSRPNITEIVLETERAYICNNIIKDPYLHTRVHDAQKKGIQAMACFPIRSRNCLFGTLNLYAREQDFFHPDIVRVFEEMAADISFALDNFDREKQRQRAEEERWETNYKLEALYKATPLPVIAHTQDGKVLSWNPEAEKVLGWSEKETLNRFIPSIPEESIPEFFEKNKRVFAGEIISRMEVKRYTKDDQCRDFLLFNAPLYDSQRTIYAIMAVLMDVTDQKRDQEHIAYLAHHDHLTGLPNRLFLKEHFARQIAYAQRSKASIALCVVDLDGFKFINDLLGHPSGDSLLCQIGKRLQNAIRSTDIVGRIGGDEFLLLFCDILSPSALGSVIQKIAKVTALPFNINEHQAYISMSMGVALYGENGTDFDTLFKRADAAMYVAKKAGGNKIEFYHQEIGVRIEKRSHIERELRKAISSDALTIHYQPICTVDDNKIVCAEALIRWQHPTWGFVPPDQFIPIAEETNQIAPLGEWILEEVCRTIQTWDAQKAPPITVAVNISAKQFLDKTFPFFVARTLQKYGLQPHRLEMEMTEGLFLENLPLVENIMQQLKTIGVSLALDDFGMGYSSLSYLKRFCIDRLKIDRSFIRDICTDEHDAILTKTIVEMGQSLGLKSIAEGVETKEQLALLQKFRCEYYQGYLCSKPMSANDFIDLLKKNYYRDLNTIYQIPLNI
jgi:diguanylate cyclase (GGDEF)-like protein/PAS domain S-box-containing protein